MPLLIVRNDITTMAVDAIVNAANSSLLGGGGVDGAIHRAAGPKLLEECRGLGGCATGDAVITGGYDLPARYVIHTVGPVWQGGGLGEERALRSCYRRSLEIAWEHALESVAFPLISSGIYGYPKDQALRIAVEEIGAFLLEDHDLTAYIVVFDRASYDIGGQLFAGISAYIDDNYADAHIDSLLERASRQNAMFGAMQSFGISGAFPRAKTTVHKDRKTSEPTAAVAASTVAESKEAIELCDALCDECALPTDESLDDHMKMLDESFSQMLLRKIDESGMTDAECYKKANIDRKLFSKIRSDRFYKPSKPTVISFAIALRLPLPETRELLSKAGFALSHSSKFDLIIEYFIERGNYDVFEINEALFAFDQPLLA
ncbi:O-acetyl-ADP-ribose deacetylase (regulator of RNase III), contains Macro domain [Ruminococcaceae bacterium YRB3002]|nr:O-acetyl-ADP-ribose deacetylase (regulator of RNase III), contains Macro domain [Ruminococcaceae bacterium YRB3002]